VSTVLIVRLEGAERHDSHLSLVLAIGKTLILIKALANKKQKGNSPLDYSPPVVKTLTTIRDSY